MGKVIVIEGSDGSGKATQTKLLYEALTAQGKKVKMVSYPCYESDSSALVKMYLEGEFGADPAAVNPYVASSFFAVDRFASFLKDWRIRPLHIMRMRRKMSLQRKLPILQ